MAHVQKSRFGQLAWESLVIFVSVAVALAADDWRETMNESQEARRSLEIVTSDLRRDSAEISTTREESLSQRAAAAWLFEKWDDGTEPARDSVGDALVVFHSIPRPAFSRSGYEGLLSGNRLGLLRDDELRQLLFEYYQVDQPAADEYWEVLWQRREGMMHRLAPHTLYRTPPEVSPPSLTLSGGWETLVSDVAVQTDIWRHGRTMEFMVTLLDSMQVSVNSLLRVVPGA